MLSHTEFINVHMLHALILQTIPFKLQRKPPTANWWVLLLALPEETSITINIVPCVKCAPETTARWKGLSRVNQFNSANLTLNSNVDQDT